LSIQEFCDGISKLATSETGIETLLMLKLQKSQRFKAYHTDEMVQEIGAEVGELRKDVALIMKHLRISERLPGSPKARPEDDLNVQ
jgi:hypothetical protein